MNEDRLLAYYDRVAEAPDAVPRLRRFVLELAVRGRLVEQDPADEPSSELIKRVAAKKAKVGNIKKQKSRTPEVDSTASHLFDVPTGWCWAPLCAVSEIIMGQSPPGETYNKSGDGVPLINGPVEFTPGPFGRTVLNQFTTAPTNFCEEGDLLICVRGSTTGRTNVAAFRACIGRGVAAIRSSFDDAFIRLFLWKAREDIISMGRGIAFPSISKGQLEELAVPLPPVAEQQRIAHKVVELMMVLDRLEMARIAREAIRDRLTTVTLGHLTAPGVDSDIFRARTRFALDLLPALTTRPDQIKILRQTILNLAVRGKLVQQDSADEPAWELLERAKLKMAKFVSLGEVSKMKAVAPVCEDDQLFSLPAGWCWARLGKLARLITKGSSPKWQGIDYVNEQGVLFITSENVGVYDLMKMEAPKFVERRFNEIEPRSILRKGDILLNLVGASIGRAAQFDLDEVANINQAVALVRPISLNEFFVNRYVLHYLNSPTGVAEMLGSRVIAAQPNISLTDTRNLLIPLPPLAEQHRIVEKVDALIALCDHMETSLLEAAATRCRLVEALLHEALVHEAIGPATEALDAAG